MLVRPILLKLKKILLENKNGTLFELSRQKVNTIFFYISNVTSLNIIIEWNLEFYKNSSLFDEQD